MERWIKIICISLRNFGSKFSLFSSPFDRQEIVSSTKCFFLPILTTLICDLLLASLHVLVVSSPLSPFLFSSHISLGCMF